MSDSISMIADEIMQQVLYGATVDWRPNMAQIAQRLREIASLRQVPEEVACGKCGGWQPFRHSPGCEANQDTQTSGECKHERSHGAPWRCAKCGYRFDDATQSTPAQAGADIVDAVDEPRGECPTCHQYLHEHAQAGAELPEFFGPDDAGCYYVKTNRGWFYARPQEMLTPEQLAELARRGGS